MKENETILFCFLQFFFFSFSSSFIIVFFIFRPSKKRKKKEKRNYPQKESGRKRHIDGDAYLARGNEMILRAADDATPCKQHKQFG